MNSAEKYSSNSLKRLKMISSALLASGVIMAGQAEQVTAQSTNEAGAATHHRHAEKRHLISLGAVTLEVNSKLAKQEVVPFALGTLYIGSAKIENPFIKPLDTKLKPSNFSLTNNKNGNNSYFGFGYTLIEPNAASWFLKYDPKKMHFVPDEPNCKSIVIDQVYFGKYPNSALNYSQAFDPNNSLYDFPVASATGLNETAGTVPVIL